MDQDTTDLLVNSLTSVLTEDSDDPLDARLKEMGWSDVVATEPGSARNLLFGVRGRTLSNADALGPLLVTTLRDRLAAEHSDVTTVLADFAGATVVLPSSLEPTGLTFTDSNEGVGTGFIAGSGGVAPAKLAAWTPALDSYPARLTIAPIRHIDIAPSGDVADDGPGFVEVAFDVDVDPQRQTGGPAIYEGAAAALAWDAMVNVARAALASELVGVAHAVIAAAVAYTGERTQYGQPIGAFQALQHRLAAAYASVVGADALAVEANERPERWTSMVAKAAAGRAAENACTQAQQCYGAIGFTWEHEFHRSLRRTYILDRVLGGYRSLDFEIGTEIQDTGLVPRIGDL